MSKELSSFVEHLAFYAMSVFRDEIVVNILKATQNYRRVHKTHTFFICRKCFAVINIEDATLAGRVDFVEECAACEQSNDLELFQQEDPWEGREKPNDVLPDERPSEYAMRKSGGK